MPVLTDVVSNVLMEPNTPNCFYLSRGEPCEAAASSLPGQGHYHCRQHAEITSCRSTAPKCYTLGGVADAPRRMKANTRNCPHAPHGNSANRVPHAHCAEHNESDTCANSPACEPVTAPTTIAVPIPLVYTSGHLNHAVRIFAAAYNKAEANGLDTRGIDMLRDEWMTEVETYNPSGRPWQEDFILAIAERRTPEEPLWYGCLTPFELAVVRRHIVHRNKINGIKALREFAKGHDVALGLKEAKDLLEGPIALDPYKVDDDVAILVAGGEMTPDDHY